MIELNQTNRLLQQLMGKLDRLIEQNDEIISNAQKPVRLIEPTKNIPIYGVTEASLVGTAPGVTN
jgi:hypothetical protein